MGEPAVQHNFSGRTSTEFTIGSAKVVPTNRNSESYDTAPEEARQSTGNKDANAGGVNAGGKNSRQLETVTFEETTQNGESRNNSSGEVFIDQDLPIQFEKRSIPKPRTQSVQSVLSSVSLRSLVHQSLQKKQAFVPPQQPSQPQFIHTDTHIQAPAIAASSKRRASFEIGQRLPFQKDLEGIKSDSHEVVEGDGETELNNTDDQRRLTDDALKRLSVMSKFVPAEVDLKMSTDATHSVDRNEPPSNEIMISNSLISTQSDIQRNTSATSLSPELPRLNLTRNMSAQMRPSASTPSLARRPSSNPSSASRQRDEQPKLMSNITSSQNLSTIPQNHQLRTPKLGVHTYSNHYNNDVDTLREASSSPQKKSFDQESLQTIGDPKRPMYIPAVLRQSNTNLKPEDLRYINEQNSRKSKTMISNTTTSLRSQAPHWRIPFDSKSKNAPTRAHWRRDLSRSSCALCSKEFTFFERRHHCRHCGDIFCGEHTSNLLRLGSDAQFTIAGSGILCKVCDACYKDYEFFLKSKFGSEVSFNGTLNKDGLKNGDERRKSVVDGSVNGGNVPVDWTWSSF